MTDGQIQAIAVVASFLVWAERDNKGMMYGSHHVDEAIEALAHLIGCTPDAVRKIAQV